MVYPLEQMRRAFLRGPLLTKANSASTQWAGRTTLQSGSATVVVSSTIVKSDSLIRLGYEGNANMGVAAGTATLNSGSATVVVSNARLASGSVVLLTGEFVTTAQLSGNAQPIDIKSQAAQNFTAGWADGQTRAFDQGVHWLAVPADGPPMPIEVRTISDADYFTLGPSNGVAVARDTIVMWQIENTK